jgi:hypothetical protein
MAAIYMSCKAEHCMQFLLLYLPSGTFSISVSLDGS